MDDQNLTPESYAREWFSFAEMDLSSAEFLLGKWPVPLAIISYHCQQAAEKYLKGFLVEYDITPPKTLDLIKGQKPVDGTSYFGLWFRLVVKGIKSR